MKETDKLIIGISHGDINGVGYEVIIKTLSDPRLPEMCTPVIYGSAKILTAYRKMLGLPNLPVNVISEVQEAKPGTVNIINVVPDDTRIDPGQSTPEGGSAAYAALECAVTDLRSGAIDALVTAPINKANIQSSTFTFPGHTEYLEASLGEGTDKSLMILYNEVVKVALVTTHLPLSRIPQAITKDAIIEKLKIFDSSLRRDFGIVHPRIAVLSLNPHAGDGGLLGSEEQEIIIPAIQEARKERIECFGPYAADGFFGHGLFRSFDGVLAMYHDQGLAPFKAIAGGSGVNFTAGLSAVRTSPDHGTGYDIAGRGEADEASFLQAIYEAIDICNHRASYDAATSNPLKKVFHEKNTKDNVVLDLTKDSDEA